jgi:hypothetical protein
MESPFQILFLFNKFGTILNYSDKCVNFMVHVFCTLFILNVSGPTNGFAGRFLGFSLYVSNTTNRAEGVLCFHDTNYTVYNIHAVLNVSCPVHGRYVIYYNERLSGVTYPDGYSQYAFAELCEVEIYGTSKYARILS